MAKTSVQFVCKNCGAASSRWQGQCTTCFAWNTLIEEKVESTPSSLLHPVRNPKKKEPVRLSTVTLQAEENISSGLEEFDRLMGGGFVRGSVSLLGGEPGIGKSTLVIQIAQKLAAKGLKVLYVTGEESVQQIFLRSQRIGANPDNLYVYAEVNIKRIVDCIRQNEPDFIILDSIQVVYHPDIPSVSGSVNQVRQCSTELINLIKEHNLVGILIGHITKEGQLAGPKVLEHLVDVILYIEGERDQKYRFIRCFKNRYFNTQEVGIFEMTETGLTPVSNPSGLFIDEVTLSSPGSAVAAVAEGTRVLLVEVQALVVDSGYGMAKRTFLGVDSNRANLLITAMEKILGVKLSAKDIILNVVGGLKVTEPALDLAIVLAMMSSLYNQPLKPRSGVFGEVGLTGELRAVTLVEKRLTELKKMGFTHIILPEKNAASVKTKNGNIMMAAVISDAIRQAFSGNRNRTENVEVSPGDRPKEIKT